MRSFVLAAGVSPARGGRSYYAGVMSQGSPLSLFDKILYWVRLLLHLMLIGSTVWMADLEIRTALTDPDLPDVAAALLGGGYGLAGVLGLVSLLSTFPSRR